MVADLLIVRSAEGLTSAVTDETQAVLVTAASLPLVDPAFLQATHDRGIILGGIETGMLAIQPFSTAAHEQPRPGHIQGFGEMYQMAVAYSITCPGDSYYSGFGMQPAADLAGLVTGMQERLLDRCDRP